MSFFIVLVSSAFLPIFNGWTSAFSALVFASFVMISYLIPEKMTRWLSIGIFPFVWMLLSLFGVKVCVFLTLCGISGGLFGLNGVKRTGNIVFFISVPVLILAAVFGGNVPFEAANEQIIVSAFSGLIAGKVCGKNIVSSCVSMIFGFAVGTLLIFRCGIFGEVYLYAALSVMLCASSACLFGVRS